MRVAFPRRWGNGQTLVLRLGRDERVLSSAACPLGRSWAEAVLDAPGSDAEWLAFDYTGLSAPPVAPNAVVAAVLDDSATANDRTRLSMLLRWAARDAGQGETWLQFRRSRLKLDRSSLPCVSLINADTLSFVIPPQLEWRDLTFSAAGLRFSGTPATLAVQAFIDASWKPVGLFHVAARDTAPCPHTIVRTGTWTHVRFITSGDETVIGLVDPILRGGSSFERRNLILIDLDTVRADRLGCYGYRDRPTSQRLDSLLEARGFFVFRHARSAGPHTLPATAKFLTSRYLNVHRNGVVPSEYETLAERLRAEGYYCAAFTGGAILEGRGFEQGFHEYHWTNWYGKVDEIYPDAIRWLRESTWRPFFLFVHTYEAHGPYTRDVFCRGLPRGRLGDLAKGEALFRKAERTTIRRGALTPAESTYVQAAYDGGIRAACDATVDLLAHLDSIGAWGQTVVVVLSDHGEEFWEHSDIGAHHSPASLYAELLDVPFMIHDPERNFAGAVSLWSEVSTVDLMPTVCDLLDIPFPADCDGVSLRPAMDGEPVARRIPIMATNDPGIPGVVPRACVYRGMRKYIERAGVHRIGAASSVSRAGGDPYSTTRQLFDLTADPRESQNLAERMPAASEELSATLDTALVLATDPAARPMVPAGPVMSERLRRQLRVLGYVDD
ncbi:MAG: sulfatase-like hydrolase/transferase [Candidatus Eisenbacteria bacterium]|nr:sulfatase-like hydrolase/transferase [Candidatus Eisenbacteria bacterium]